MANTNKTESIMRKSTSRRTVLGTTAGLAVTGAGMRSVRAQEGTPTSSPAVGGDGEILKSAVKGVPDVILKAPTPFKSYEGAPANGGEVTYIHLIWASPATRHDANPFWQELEKRLNVERFKVTEIPVESYEEKVSALLAGGDLGDLFYIHSGLGPTAALNQAIEQGAFTDLTEELTGENLKKYPNLARFPEEMWVESKINGKIYGVPQPLAKGSAMTWYRRDWAGKLGLSAPTNADKHFEFLKAFREQDPDGNGAVDTFAMCYPHAAFIEPMFRVPNGWRLNDDRTLTNAIETEEWVNSVLFQKRLWDAGMIHPDAASITVTQMIDLFYGGQTGAMTAGFGTWFGDDPGRQVAIKKTQPKAELAPFMPIGFDGGEAFVHLDPAYFGTVAIPSNVGKDKDRLQELLRICDYFYPPFGSEEYLFLNYGIKGVHYTLDESGVPVINDRGLADISNLIYGFLVLDLYIYHPGYPEQARAQQKLLEVLIPKSVADPTQGLYSPTFTKNGPVLSKLVEDTVNDVVYGRKSTDELQKMQEQWRSRGGDDIRKEFQDLLKSAG